MSHNREIIIRYNEKLLEREVNQMCQMGWEKEGEVTSKKTPLNGVIYKQILVKK